MLEPAALVIAAEWSLAVRPGRYSGLGLYLEWGTAEYDSRRQRGLLRGRPRKRVGGRFLEIHALESGAGLEGGRVAVWEPGERLALTWTQLGWPAGVSTDVDVTFDPGGERTLVRLEQTGFEHVPDAEKHLSGYDAGWKEVLG